MEARENLMSESTGTDATQQQIENPRLLHRRVIIAGYGPVGRMTADKLAAAGIDITIVDLNPKTIERQMSLDRSVIYGDVTDPALLETAEISRADALILTIPDEKQAIEACRVARQINPDLFIAVRTNFLSQGMLAREAGADDVIVEEVVTAEAMRRAVVNQLLK